MDLKHLCELTGLREAAGQACLVQNHNCPRTALASFVQAHAAIPTTFYDASVAEHNAKRINDEVHETYTMVKAVRDSIPKLDDSAVWAELRKHGWKVEAVRSAHGIAPTSPSKMSPAPSPATADPKPSGSAASPKPDFPAAKSNKPAIPVGNHHGPLLDMPGFWEKEVLGRCPLLNLNKGFMQKNREVLPARMKKWLVHTTKFYSEAPVEYFPITDPDEEFQRVILRDSERTFFDPVHREKFAVFLYSVYKEFGNYGQPLSYFAGICLLTLSEQETMSLLRKVNKEYIPGHWKDEFTGFSTNAYITLGIVKSFFPAVHAHFESINFTYPDTYMQKILNALCVHVLQFDQLFDFLERFLQEGFAWLVKFFLAIIDKFQKDILKMKTEQIGELYDLLKLDPKCVDSSDTRAILKKAESFDVSTHLENIDILRMKVFDEKVLPKLQRAPKTLAYEPCVLCEKGKPTLFCIECEETMCQACHEGGVGEHRSTHETEPY